MAAHEQVWVKVNAQADRGIAPLVQALNEFQGVMTVSSCEGDADHEAYVSFTAGEDWQRTGDFIQRLSAALGQAPGLCDRATFALCLEWYLGGKTPVAYLRMPTHHVPLLAAAVRDAAGCLAGWCPGRAGAAPADPPTLH